MPDPVLTKADFVERYARGEFGNAAPTWQSYEDWFYSWFNAHSCNNLYHVRNRVAGGNTWYNLRRLQVWGAWQRANLLSPGNWYISAMAPTAKTLIQGEVMRWPGYLYLYYTTVAKPMREALATKAQHATGVVAAAILRRFMDANSYDWLWHLLDSYPNHAVEFSTYSVEWGTVAGFNTVFWEVRRY